MKKLNILFSDNHEKHLVFLIGTAVTKMLPPHYSSSSSSPSSHVPPQVFYSGIEEQATNIIYGASEGHDQKGVTGAVGGILRQIPPTLVRPLVLASEATANVLGGMRNQIAPEARRNDAEKWRQNSS